MFAVDSYSKRRSRGLRESREIIGPWERGCQIRKDCVTGHSVNYFIVIPYLTLQVTWFGADLVWLMYYSWAHKETVVQWCFILEWLSSLRTFFYLLDHIFKHDWNLSAQLSRHLGGHATEDRCVTKHLCTRLECLWPQVASGEKHVH